MITPHVRQLSMREAHAYLERWAKSAQAST